MAKTRLFRPFVQGRDQGSQKAAQPLQNHCELGSQHNNFGCTRLCTCVVSDPGDAVQHTNIFFRLTTEATSNASTTLMRARLEQKETKISEFDIQQKEAIIAIEQMLQAFMVDVLG